MEPLLPVANVLGRLLLFFSLSFLAPAAAAWIFDDGTAAYFLDAMALTAGLGGVLLVTTRGYVRELKVRDGFLLVTGTWVIMALTASLPFMLAYEAMSFTDAFFESMSALTTSGATVMSGLDAAPPGINLWRHELQWLGGMGIIVLAVAILPMLGVGGMQLYRAEMPGPMKESRITARIADTAAALWMVYFALTFACLFALRLAGMSWFDAICHALSTVSLGGFSTRDASIAAFDSAAIEAVVVVFMIVSAVNFATHFLAWRARSLRRYWLDAEARGVVLVLAAACLVLIPFLYVQGTFSDPTQALRQGTFNVISVALGCGFATVDYSHWPIFAPTLMLFLSCIAASSGSPGSGIKMIRTIVLAKQSLRELHLLLHPNLAERIKVGNVVVPNKVAFSVLGFIYLYFMTFVTLAIILMASGMEFITAISAAVAAINNVGPALGEIGPAGNYAGITDFQKWVFCAGMLLGRLEILSVAVLFTRHFWRK